MGSKMRALNPNQERKIIRARIKPGIFPPVPVEVHVHMRRLIQAYGRHWSLVCPGLSDDLRMALSWGAIQREAGLPNEHTNPRDAETDEVLREIGLLGADGYPIAHLSAEDVAALLDDEAYRLRLHAQRREQLARRRAGGDPRSGAR